MAIHEFTWAYLAPAILSRRAKSPVLDPMQSSSMDWKLLAFEIGIFLLISLVITLAGYGYSLYLAIMSLQEVQTVSGTESGEVFRQNLKYALVGSGIVGVSVACLIWGLLAPEPRKPLPREEDERFR